jgi:hypothetical protein
MVAYGEQLFNIQFQIGTGVTGPGVTGPGVTGPGVTGPGLTGHGPTGWSTSAYNQGVTGQGVTGQGVTGQGVTGPGTTGPGATGQGLTGSNGINATHRAGYEIQESHQKEINKRFYNELYKLFENEEQSKIKTKQFFDMTTQLEKDPGDYLEKGVYFHYAISYFYTDDPITTNDLWLRYKTNFYQIKLDEKSGSIYQSPYDNQVGFIYIGFSETDGACICLENSKTITFFHPYYFSRSTLIHDVRNSVMGKNKLDTNDRQVTEPFKNNVVDLILSGKLSDDEIECSDGIVKISKSLLALHSNYFLYLFTNDSFKKQESYKIDFSKKILQYYIRYCCSSLFKEKFDPELTIDMIAFGDFIQDKKFLQSYYSEIYDHRDLFTNKSLLGIIKIYQDLSL